MVDFFLEIFFHFLVEYLANWVLVPFEYTGAFVKSLFKKKPFKEILKERWNTRLGFIVIFILVRLIILLIDKL